ncbi:MAG: exopolyphosphatase [Desulfobacteraceae bacterium]|nr:exopolyphosphatase [Desulfobacteraceae bacterium]
MRIVTRPDFDGIVCAVFIEQAENITEPVQWIEPGDVQQGTAEIKPGDIMANLPYDERCSIWFDHHISNVPVFKVEGSFKIAPSAAGIVYEYYKEKGLLQRNYDELVEQTDIIDAAELTKDQVLNPEKYPYILLSMTVKNKDESDLPYWNKLVSLLKHVPIKDILEDKEVKKRAENILKENIAYEKYLKEYTKIHGNISVTDFRSFDKSPSGNRFLTYHLFPDTIASITIRNKYKNKNQILLSIGKSIFNNKSNVNIGKLLSGYNGGGHDGAGGCTLDIESANKDIEKIISIMVEDRAV